MAKQNKFKLGILLCSALVINPLVHGSELPAVNPILPLNLTTSNHLMLDESLRDPVVTASVPRDESEAAQLVQDLREYQNDLSRSQGARREELIEKTFEGYAALVAYLSDSQSTSSNANHGDNLASSRRQTIAYAEQWSKLTKNPSHRARALYHAAVNRYLLNENRAQQLSTLEKIKGEKLAKPLSQRIDFLLAYHAIDSQNKKEREKSIAVMARNTSNGTAIGVAANLSLAKAYAGLNQKGVLVRKSAPQYKSYLAKAVSKASNFSEARRMQILDTAVSTFKTAEGKNIDWTVLPFNLNGFEANTTTRALIERSALSHWQKGDAAKTLKKYEALARTFDEKDSATANKLDQRIIELNHALYVHVANRKNAMPTTIAKAAATYEKSLISVTNNDNASENLKNIAQKRRIDLVNDMLNRALKLAEQRSNDSTVASTAIRMTEDYVLANEQSNPAVSDQLRARTGTLYAARNQHIDAVRVFSALAEKSQSPAKERYLNLAINSQTVVAQWTVNAPWESVQSSSSVKVAEREALASMYRSLLATKKVWATAAQIGLLEVATNKSEQAFALWSEMLQQQPQGRDAALASGLMLTSYVAAKQWQNAENTARLCLNKNIQPVAAKKGLDARSYLALALLEGGKEALEGQRFEVAVTKLYEFSKNHPNAKNHDQGFFLLASAYRGAAKHNESIQTLQAFSERYENSKFFRQALLNGGDWSAPMGHEDHTLYFYSKFLKKFSNDREAFRVSADLVDVAIGKSLFARATETLLWQVQQSQADSATKASAARRILEIEERQGDRERAFQYASQFSNARWADTALKAESIAFVARYHATKMDLKKLQATEKVALSLSKSEPESQEALGEIRFLLADSVSKGIQEEIFNLELKNPLATVNAQYKVYVDAKTRYTKVCEAGSTSWCAPALNRIATLSGSFIKAIEEVDIAETLAKEEVDAFRNRKNSLMDSVAKIGEAADARALALVSEGKTNPDWTQKVLWSNSSDWNFERVSGETGNAYIQYSATKAE